MKHTPVGMRFGALVAALIATLTAALFAPAIARPQETETFRATAQHIGSGPSGQTSVIIVVSRWSSDEERDALANALLEDGNDGLYEALVDQEEVGFIRFPSSRTRFPSVRLRYAREFRDGDRRVLRLATDRPIGWVEAVVRPSRTYDNRISIIELQLEGDEGEGVMAVGVEIEVDEATNTLTITNISSQPVRLVNVRKSN